MAANLCTLAAIVIGNLVPAVGVVGFDWDVGAVLSLFWLENLIVGFFTVWKMRLALGDAGEFTPRWEGDIRPDKFFLIHYGGFTLAHGLFVILVCVSLHRPESARELVDELAALWSSLLIGSLALLAEHAAAFYFDYVQNEPFKRTTAEKEMFKPYPRLMALHGSLLVGAVVFHSFSWMVLLLVALHLVIDVAAWARRLPAEGPLEPIRNAIWGGTLVGATAFLFGFVLGACLLGLVGWIGELSGFSSNILDHAPLWAFYAAAVLSCLAATGAALTEILDAIPAFRMLNVSAKRLVTALVAAGVTGLVVWGVFEFLPL